MLKNCQLLFTFLSAFIISLSVAECPNACSAHGRCGAFDMCSCYRNWMANDCSERVCQFGIAHVDTPKGDLDSSSGKLSGPNVGGEDDNTVSRNSQLYPYGTQEQYPDMRDSDKNVLDNTAHYYMECSNKGYCDRSSGTCSCFEGYSGSACQRASCPTTGGAVCSGHGTCETIRNLAALDYGNVYNLWDQDSTLGCKCDGGFAGPDCSLKVCKFGADPLYYDDFANVRYANFSYEIYTTVEAYQSTLGSAGWGANFIVGNYSLVFVDHTGEDWETGPIDISANCDDVTNALEALPNNVIPSGSVRCFQDNNMDIPDVATGLTWFQYCKQYGVCVGGLNYYAKQWDLTSQELYLPYQGYYSPKFTLAFPANPGKIQQIRINKFLDGARPTLYTVEGTFHSTTFRNHLATTVSVPINGVATTVTTAEADTLNAAVGGSDIGNGGAASRRLDFVTQGFTNFCYENVVGSCSANTRFALDDTIPSSLSWHIYANGFTGEDTDFVPDLCEGITVTIDKSQTPFKLAGMSTQDIKTLKRCLGDSDNITDNNVDVYNWDYGFGAMQGDADEWGTSGSKHVPAFPHLIKLIDATQDHSYLNRLSDRSGVGSNPAANSNAALTGGKPIDDDAVVLDHSLDAYPKTTLCSSRSNYIDFPVNQFDGAHDLHLYKNNFDLGWCANKNPPGFYAALYFDPPTVSNGHQGEFILMGPTGLDYGTTNGVPTRFHLYTTTGMLVRISDDSAVFTAPHNSLTAQGASKGANLYSNTLYVGRLDGQGSVTGSSWNGNFDCETNPSGSHNTRDCLSKNDYVMFFSGGKLNAGTWTRAVDDSALYKKNPTYPNMYQVQKIGRVPVSPTTGYPGSLTDAAAFGNNYDRELTRNQIVLDYGVNFKWENIGTSTTVGGFAYKFYPPVEKYFAKSGSEDSTAPEQRTPSKVVDYVGECSLRGICDHGTGLCQCFPGYTSDNCGVQSALVA